jgi:UrcA family protein
MKPLAKTLTHALAALGLAGAAITPALADEGATKTIAVTTSDINLATAKGQKTLDQRIERAARAVCRTTNLTTGSRIMSQDAQACLAKARTSAQAQVAVLKADQQRGG